MRVTILDDYFNTLPTLPSFHKLDGHEVTVWNDHVQDNDGLAERLRDTEALILIRERTRIDGDLLDRLPNLKLISQRGYHPHVDVPGCTRNGVLLCSSMHGDTPSYGAAELTIALMMASLRQIPQQVASLKAGNWQMGVGRTLRQRTLGIYGYGRIGKAVAGYAAAFEMPVQWWGSEEGRERARAGGETVPESREAFFATSDVVTLHVRLLPETRGIVTLDDLLAMRPDSLLVNTSRAGLIAPGVLLEALNAGRPGSAAVDVFDVEPLRDTNDPLLNHPNLLATPHIGYVTQDEMDRGFSEIYDQVLAFIAGSPINAINPEALG